MFLSVKARAFIHMLILGWQTKGSPKDLSNLIKIVPFTFKPRETAKCSQQLDVNKGTLLGLKRFGIL